MKLLHTGDWHIGKVLRGVPRLDEQRVVLDEIVGLVGSEHVDVVLVAGDVFDTSSPTAGAQQVAFSALLAMRQAGAQVLVVAGNHDAGDAFEAWRPLFAAAGIELRGRLYPPDNGGLIDVSVESSGERLLVAMVPFVSQRRIVRADDLFALADHERQGKYRERMRSILDRFAQRFVPDAVNVILAHATVANARFGGGERMSQSIFDYLVDPADFPANCSYIALGHLHQQQTVPVGAPARYSGSPISVDFGDADATPSVVLVDVSPARPAKARPHALTTPRKLRTITAGLAELATLIERGVVGPDDLLRVVVSGAPRAVDLADRVRALLPNALEVRTDAATPVASGHEERRSAIGRLSPTELFRRYLSENTGTGIVDERLLALFDELLVDSEDSDLSDGPDGTGTPPLPPSRKSTASTAAVEAAQAAPKPNRRAPKEKVAKGTGANGEEEQRDLEALLAASIELQARKRDGR